MTRQKDEPLRVEQVHIERAQDGRARVRIGEWVSEPMTREEAQQREAEFCSTHRQWTRVRIAVGGRSAASRSSTAAS